MSGTNILKNVLKIMLKAAAMANLMDYTWNQKGKSKFLN